MSGPDRASRRRKVGLVAVAFVAAAAVVTVLVRQSATREPEPAGPAADLARQVHDLCAACHLYPPPDSFPAGAWAQEVVQGYDFAGEFRPDLPRPPVDRVIDYYRSRAPMAMP